MNRPSGTERRPPSPHYCHDVSVEYEYVSDNVVIIDNATTKALARVPFAEVKKLVADWIRRTRDDLEDDELLLGR